jgi:DNA-binding GntR family transcriptional regulator
MIRKGDLVCGQKVDEKVLCESMGVSRTPIRESLRILHSEGLIDLIPHKGAYISTPKIDELKDMFEVMGMLEGMCARLATKRMNAYDLKKIRSLHDKLEQHYAHQDREMYLEVNNVFHLLIQEISGNKALQGVLNGLRQKILLYRHRQLYHKNRFDQSMQEHRAILAAFEKRDARLAEISLKHHLEKQCEALVDYYAAEGAEKRDDVLAA